MAHSKVNRIGTIFSRVTSLLKGGAIEEKNLPLWYDIYKAFPPKDEPNFNRRPPQKEISNILYKEDEIRAKFHKAVKHLTAVDLNSEEPTATQLFLNTYNNLLKNGMNEKRAYRKTLANFKLFNITKRDKFNASSKTSSKGDSK